MLLKKIIFPIFAFTFGMITWGCSNKAQADVIDTFEYCEIYLPEHGTEEYELLGLKNLDDEWGIWGHNLAQTFPDRVSQSIYARRDGEIHKEQFCFSSNELYEYVEQYIKDNYSGGDTIRFAILPNDNTFVCGCSKCVAAGNTTVDASPAVLKMIEKLAAKFPKHLFFTSYYASTKSIPDHKLPDNVGVLISAIDFPLSTEVTSKETDFKKLLEEWSKKSDRVYVWDYVNNFDDYFTPYPVFEPMQRRIKMYVDAGVNGVFLNGSGYDYSSLSRLKTIVLAAIFKDPSVDWRTALKEKAKELYPATGDIISDFMITQEEYVMDKGKELPLYDGVSKALETYLPEEKFVEFHERLSKAKASASNEEKDAVEKLFDALELTRLEMMRLSGDVDGYEPHLSNLMKLDTQHDIHVYSESCWTLKSYDKDFKQIASQAKKSEGNKLRGVKITSVNGLDPDYTDLSILTDGLLGMPSNYHNGIVIRTPDDKWILSIPPVAGLKTLRIWLVTNPAFKIDLPNRINLMAGGNLLGSVVPKIQTGDKVGHTYVDIPVTVSGVTLTVTLAKGKETRSMAVEEIEGF